MYSYRKIEYDFVLEAKDIIKLNIKSLNKCLDYFSIQDNEVLGVDYNDFIYNANNILLVGSFNLHPDDLDTWKIYCKKIKGDV